MVPRDRLIVGKKNLTLKEAYTILENEKKGKLPIVNENDELISLIARTDLKKAREFPLSSYDSKNQLMVGAAINTRETSRKYVEELVKAGVDVLVIVCFFILIILVFKFYFFFKINFRILQTDQANIRLS